MRKHFSSAPVLGPGGQSEALTQERGDVMRLLLVEDDLSLGDGMRTVLTQAGWSVDWVQDGYRADQVLGALEFDMVLLDMGLPRLPGLGSEIQAIAGA